MIFGINTTSDISKLLYVISRAVGRVKFETILKYHEWYLCQISLQIMLLIVYTTTLKRFVIFTCRYFKLSWNTTAQSQSNCRNFSYGSISIFTSYHFSDSGLYPFNGCDFYFDLFWMARHWKPAIKAEIANQIWEFCSCSLTKPQWRPAWETFLAPLAGAPPALPTPVE